MKEWMEQYHNKQGMTMRARGPNHKVSAYVLAQALRLVKCGDMLNFDRVTSEFDEHYKINDRFYECPKLKACGVEYAIPT